MKYAKCKFSENILGLDIRNKKLERTVTKMF